MDAEILLIDQGSKWQSVKHFMESFPNVFVTEESGALTMEAKKFSDSSGFVVSSQESHSFRIFDLQSSDQRGTL